MRARLFLRCLSLLVLCAVLAGWTGAYTDVRATETADTEDLEQQKKDTEDKIDSIKSSIDTVEDKFRIWRILKVICRPTLLSWTAR